MQEILALAFEYLRGVWRFRWFGLLTAWIVCVAGWIYVAQLPEKYVASARVHIDTNSVLRPLLRGIAIQPNVDQRIALLSRTLKSRPSLEKLMRMTDLDLNAKSEAQKEGILRMLKGGVRLSGSRRNSSIYSVSFKHSDRDTAKRVVQAVLTVFIESTLGEKRTESEGAQEFLDQQIKDYEQRLTEAEHRRADFKRRHAGSLPGSSGGYYGKLQGAKGQLAGAELKLKEARNRLRQLKQQLEFEEPEIEADALLSQEFSPLDARIQGLQAKLDGLLVNYTERHPAVRQIQGLIAELEEERSAVQETSLTSGGLDAVKRANPVYQQIKNLINSTQAEIASLTVRVEEYKQRVARLQGALDSIPQIEAQMKQLDRDYGVIMSQHQALIKRREKASLGDRVSQSADDVKFRVIDPPFVPAKPNEPNKTLLNTGVFVAGVGAGTGVALLISLLRPVFGDRRRLSMATGLPVFGTVTLIRSPEEKRRVLIFGLLFASISLLLLALYAAVSADQILGLDVVGKLKSIYTGLL